MKTIRKHHRVAALLAGTALAASVFAIVPVAQAAGLTQTQINAVTTLLQAFGADAGTIATVQAALSGAPASAPPTSGALSAAESGSGGAASCLPLSGPLGMGSKGEDVARLQQFLASSTPYFPHGLVTGYYGRVTEDAVQHWQEAHNIVATGTPSTTGYGAVGPATRGEIEKEMETECAGTDSQALPSSRGAESSASSTDSNAGDN